jgi:hypothetical protein
MSYSKCAHNVSGNPDQLLLLHLSDFTGLLLAACLPDIEAVTAMLQQQSSCPSVSLIPSRQRVGSGDFTSYSS